jgi:hypothetical protein
VCRSCPTWKAVQTGAGGINIGAVIVACFGKEDMQGRAFVEFTFRLGRGETDATSVSFICYFWVRVAQRVIIIMLSMDSRVLQMKLAN